METVCIGYNIHVSISGSAATNLEGQEAVKAVSESFKAYSLMYYMRRNIANVLGIVGSLYHG